MGWQDFTSQLMKQRSHYRRQNQWLHQWDLPDTQQRDSRNEWEGKLICWWNLQWIRLWIQFLLSFCKISWFLWWFTLKGEQSCHFSFFVFSCWCRSKVHMTFVNKLFTKKFFLYFDQEFDKNSYLMIYINELTPVSEPLRGRVFSVSTGHLVS